MLIIWWFFFCFVTWFYIFLSEYFPSSDKNNITDNYLPLPLVFFINTSVDIQKYKKKITKYLAVILSPSGSSKSYL